MPATLETNAIEEGTYIITASFTDEDGEAVVPDAVAWTLTDRLGNVINDREDVVFTPATSVEIVLTGDDLAIGTRGSLRIVTIEGTYDSDAGSGLHLKDEVRFQIDNLTHVP